MSKCSNTYSCCKMDTQKVGLKLLSGLITRSPFNRVLPLGGIIIKRIVFLITLTLWVIGCGNTSDSTEKFELTDQNLTTAVATHLKKTYSDEWHDYLDSNLEVKILAKRKITGEWVVYAINGLDAVYHSIYVISVENNHPRIVKEIKSPIEANSATPLNTCVTTLQMGKVV